MKKIFTLLTMSLAGMSLPGCMYMEPTTLPPGQYEHTSKSVDSQGTERKEQSSTEVYYDEYGNKKMAVDKKTSTDPKGLFNKSTTETHKTVE